MLKAIRENEPRAISLGYDVDRYKLLAFMLSAAVAGLAGATKTIVFQLASLTDVHWTTSGDVVLMTLLGGLGTMLGPVVGAFVIVATQNYLAEFGSWVTIIQGALFIACVLSFRRGIVGERGEPAAHDWLAGERPAMLALLETLVNIDSGSYDKAGVDAVGARVRAFWTSTASRTRRSPTRNSATPSRAPSAGRR